MLFWFVAEDRGALLQPDPDDADTATRASLREARDRYAAYFSSARLRQLARRHRGSRHGDLFDAAQLVFDALGTEGGVPELALPGIGGIFESQHDDGTRAPARRTARRRPPVQRGPARRRPRAVPGKAARRRRLAAGGLRQPGRRRTRQRLRVPAGTDPPLRRRAARLHAGDTGRQRAERVRLLLHADLAGRMPAGLRARPAARRGVRPRDGRGTGLGAPGHHRLRPRLRIRPLPRRRRPADRQAHRRRGNRRIRAARRRGPGSAAPSHRPLHLRRRHQPHGRRTSQGLALAGSAGARQAAVLPRPEHPRRQLPARRHPRPARRRPARTRRSPRSKATTARSPQP